ncbi:MAG: zf-TFIIB domain-containing protein [Elusimicrobia bacterium]|nr:zf-TFIIB domain-containing protein [Elusimicrobiota bacterium]
MPLSCPSCAETALKEHTARPGLVVDCCPACGGAWLDIGEVYAFTKDSVAARDALKAAYGRPMPSARSCPRCARAMSAVRLEASGLVVEACPGCGGNWFDRDEVARFAASLLPPPPAPAPEDPRQRLLTEEEASLLAGPDISLFIGIAVALCGAGALGVLWVLRGSVTELSAEGAGPFLLGAVVAAATAVLAARTASARSRKLHGAWLVAGTVSARSERGGVLVDLAVDYPFGGQMRTVRLQVPAGAPLDAALGARSWVAVRPERPADGVVVAKPG